MRTAFRTEIYDRISELEICDEMEVWIAFVRDFLRFLSEGGEQKMKGFPRGGSFLYCRYLTTFSIKASTG